MSENEIGVEEARKVLGRLVDDAALSGVTTFLTRRGRRYAAIAPLTALKESTMATTDLFDMSAALRAADIDFTRGQTHLVDEWHVALPDGWIAVGSAPSEADPNTLWWTATRCDVDEDGQPGEDHEFYDGTDPAELVALIARVLFGVLIDASTGEELGPATKAQREASDDAGETGIFLADRDLDPCDESADPKVFGPLRTVWVRA